MISGSIMNIDIDKNIKITPDLIIELYNQMSEVDFTAEERENIIHVLDALVDNIDDYLQIEIPPK